VFNNEEWVEGGGNGVGGGEGSGGGGGGSMGAKDEAMEEAKGLEWSWCAVCGRLCTLQHDFGSNETQCPPLLEKLPKKWLVWNAHRLECELLPPFHPNQKKRKKGKKE
jgi:hypothetical protein